MQTNIKWDVRQRLTLLESTVFWNGGLRTNSLVNTFGISRVQASKDLSLYQSLCPANIKYDKHKKCYLVTDRFSPAFINGTSEEYLRLLNLAQTSSSGLIVPLVDKVPEGLVVNPVSRKISTQILQKVIQSIYRHEELEIVYRTMSRLKTVNHVVCPHVILSDGLRWYMRGYSYNHEEFRNFILARILEADFNGKADIDVSEDHVWQTEIDVKIGVHPELSDLQKAVIETDYGMRKGVLVHRIRAALLPFFLSAMHIRINNAELKSVADPIILLNRDELDRYLKF